MAENDNDEIKRCSCGRRATPDDKCSKCDNPVAECNCDPYTADEAYGEYGNDPVALKAELIAIKEVEDEDKPLSRLLPSQEPVFVGR